MHPLNYISTYHIDSTTLADGDYELISELGVEIAEDPGNVVGSLTETPNQSSENFDTPNPSPANKGKPRCITQYFKLLHYAILCLYILYLALSIGDEMEP
jgi:hypothetical protein